MIQTLYVNNFRCLQNFELNLLQTPQCLLIGSNGAGKSTVRSALEVFQKIGRGQTRVDDLVKQADFTRWSSVRRPVRLEITVRISEKIYKYRIAFELPENFRMVRVHEESLSVDGLDIFTRHLAETELKRNSKSKSVSKFGIDWHTVALPVIQDSAVEALRGWLGSMVILAPITDRIDALVQSEHLTPSIDASDMGCWVAGLLAQYPASYGTIDRHLKAQMVDFHSLQFERVGPDARVLWANFSSSNSELKFKLNELSSGEKCFVLSAVLLAANQASGPLFCFWDEPDQHLALDEVGLFVQELRRSMKGGQLIISSHNAQAIPRFSQENTIVLSRASHSEPTRLHTAADVFGDTDVVTALSLGELSA